MNDNRKQWKEKLDDELKDVTFQNVETVIKRTHPKTWTERLQHWLNQETQFPIVPASAVLGVVLLLVTIPLSNGGNTADDKGQLVDMKSSIYWSEMIEEKLGDQ
ncbi:hypothetical protein [Alkalihalobacterium alkalinitrilicum]|uniref:hypothetical protein n=1 Tax=Alkalihalobacterium alkalinitrilicum TaxID=427920 RepID=UPI00099522D3|nr:hypothetical protein [Alkalihalobacterium alkalinitrilicum]